VTNLNVNRSLVIAICLLTSTGWADTLELTNGSLIKGKFVGRTENEISFRVGSSVQKYDLADINLLNFDSGTAAGDTAPRPSLPPTEASTAASTQATKSVTIPPETHISVRTIDDIDSTKDHPGDRFQASLEEPLIVNGDLVAAKGADVYGRLAESKKSGTFSGRSELQLELTGIAVNGQTVPLVTGDYELKGKSRELAP
jgi:hypothetical protein